ncbi:hypothetical protein BCR37DRAFT_383014 [Protomyces lactucae-debilis]|uniref:DUF2470 domain-containing protein n=1 Tax=Protomyces lactucae-debilis TaxID=2754530 RepID=A0A1Y2EZY1_PROLT|nr:uncharacterized protein BCR37DRAFT_383014 [Protomyces lactucae-debilis]ORY77017.1 hypothetical protein BCR37DRAFT_383014 [Protomyces lactucae-debilis]
MSDQQEAVKQRIMKHMNEDHADSLSAYLQHYHGLSTGEIKQAQLTDLSDEGMYITPDTAAGHSYLVKFTPPLQNLEGIRPRVIAMAKEAQEGIKG